MSIGSDVLTGASSYEYTVVRKKDGKIRRRQALLMTLYTVFCAVGLLGGASLFRLFAPLIALVPVLLWILVFFTWRWTQIEYDYAYLSGTLILCTVYGNRTRRTLAKIDLRRIHALLPARGSEEEIARFAPERTLYALSTPDAEQGVCLLCTEEGGQRLLLRIEVDRNAERIFRYYNASATKVRTQS